MKSSRREFPKWDAVAGAGTAIPALAHNIHILTNEHARTFYCPASHSLGIQLQSAVPAQFVDPLPTPSVIRTITGSITSADLKVVQRQLRLDLSLTAAKRKRRQKLNPKEHLEDPAPADHRPNPEQAGTFAWKEYFK